jgi:carboxyl-terminal processing protease
MRILKAFLICIHLFFLPHLVGKEAYLGSKDVKPMMEKFFEIHIEKKEMDKDLMQRAWGVYLKNFDTTFAYLLEEEVQPYLNPKAEALTNALAQYHKDRFTSFFTLNQTIEGGIQRARHWRASWEKDPVSIVKAAQEISKKVTSDKDFPRLMGELQTRHYHRLLRLIAYMMEELPQKNFEGAEHKLVKLCERQICSMENAYLRENEKGEPLTEKEWEHHVITRTLKSLAYSLDAHTAFFSPDEAYAMRVQLEKGMCGIGVVLREGLDGVTVHDLIKGGPAEQSQSLLVGDTIVEVDGEPVQDASFQHVLEVMRGKEGTAIQLGVLRSGTENKQTVTLVRAKIALDDKRVDIHTEPYGDGHIGMLTLHSFYEGENDITSEKDLKAAIAQLQKQAPLHGLVLDMRENSGGFLTQAVKVCNLFISSGVVVISKYSDGTIRYFRAVDGEKVFDGPLVVLVSKGSASAAEIVAAALQDFGVAVVVGDKHTYGKGTIQHQTVTNTKTPAFFKVTVGRYYTVSGRTTQIEGVQSDIVIPTALHYEEVGERYLDYPVSQDRVEPAYQDNLKDVDPFARKWFKKYYLPNLQKKETTWDVHMALLKENSEIRQKESQNHQNFLKRLKNVEDTSIHFGEDDLQLKESVNILKDMIYLKNEAVWEQIP